MGLGIASAILGGVQLVGGIAAAASLGDRPSYTEDPNFSRSASRAETMAGMGYTPQERAAFQGDLASSQATDYQRGMDVSGGNMAQALLGINTSRSAGALNRFAAQDAALRRENIRYADSFSRERQARRDAQTNLDTQYRMAEERAIGGAIQSGLNNIAGMANLNQAMSYNPGAMPQSEIKAPEQKVISSDAVAQNYSNVLGGESNFFSPESIYSSSYGALMNFPYGGFPGLLGSMPSSPSLFMPK